MNYEYEILKRVKNLFVWLFRRYKKGVIADGGSVRSDSLTTAYLKMCQQNRMSKSIQFAWLGESGAKFRTSGIYSYFTKLYSLIGSNHAVQTTTATQPYLCGNIATNEKYGLKNPNGAKLYVSHPVINYGANNAWSVTILMNINSIGLSQPFLGATLASNNSMIALTWNTKYLYYRSSNGNAASIYQLETIIRQNAGKNLILNIIADGIGNLAFYFNGVLRYSQAIDTSFRFENLGIAATYNTSNFYGSISAYILRSQALTQSQITAEYNHFRALYPEIPSVQIGAQTWATSNLEMVCTPQGNLIANVTETVNVEKISNIADREFSSDTGWWSRDGGWSISGGIARAANLGNSASVYKTNILTAQKWYKVEFTILNYVQGGVRIRAPFLSPNIKSSNGTFIEYVRATDTTFSTAISIQTAGASTTLDIDNISVQEIGWSGSQELYDGVYAQTTGTTEQKTYAAVKAAAMWCYYNNNSAVGAVYGKLYNWFAAKLLQMDIDYYNVANPIAPWGWRVPTNTDFSTLQTTLGGAAISGKKLKVTGSTYWSAANGDNLSGFSAIGIGNRNATGAFGLIGSYCNLLSSIEASSTTNYYMYIRSAGDETAIGSSSPKNGGLAIRLIKV